MATKKTIELNGILTEVWEFESSAQEIDDTVANAVKKSGGTMTGDLTLEKAFPVFSLKNTNNGQTGRMNVGNDNTVGFYNRTDDNNTVGVYLKKAAQKSADAFCVSHKFNGTANYYTVLHTGGKPTGSYTGNGSSTSRAIDTKGIGSTIFIRGGAYGAIISSNGGIAWATSDGSFKTFVASEASFTSGTLTLATTNTYLNNNGTTYYYHVL